LVESIDRGVVPVSPKWVTTSDNGNPLTVPSVGGSSVNVTLNPFGTTVIEAPNAGSLTQGYASMRLPAGIVGYGVFRQSVQGIADQEAVVPLSLTGASSATLTWDDTNYVTAVAIVNPSNSVETISIIVLDAAGTLVGTSQLNLPANGKTAVAFRTLPGLAAMAGKRGSATFTVTAGASPSVVVLGLRFFGAAFTSIPVSQ
jgi:hypothetical protein